MYRIFGVVSCKKYFAEIEYAPLKCFGRKQFRRVLFCRTVWIPLRKLYANAHRQGDPIGEQMVRSHRQRDSVGRVTDNAIRQVHRCIFFYSELYTIPFRQQLSPLATERASDARCRQNRCNPGWFSNFVAPMHATHQKLRPRVECKTNINQFA